MPDSNTSSLDRRAFLASAATAAVVGPAALGTLSTPAAAAPQAAPRTPVLGGSGPLFATAETTYGKVQGRVMKDIRVFKGVPYGADTGGKNRFMPPKKPAPWAGVRDCFDYGQISPQTPSGFGKYQEMISWDMHPGGMGENCLTLNIWTPAVNDGGKRPVMVWFHGGGHSVGSGNHPSTDGLQLASYGNAVVITVNHRLSGLGYYYLTGLGAPEEFRYSGINGALDTVAALEWVRDNAAAFGGDPNNVLIFGQSGGGAKVSTVMGMPKAKGLFHRASVQSGSFLKMTEPEAATKLAAAVMAKLGIGKGDWKKLQQIPWQAIVQADADALGGFSPIGPTVGTDLLPTHPFDPGAPAVSAQVPMLISYTLEDAAMFADNFDVTDAQLRAILNKRFAGKGDQVVDLYRTMDGKKPAYRLQNEIMTDLSFGANAVRQAERKAAQDAAPVWMYRSDWSATAYEGVFGATHGMDTPALFRIHRDLKYAGMAEGVKFCDQMASLILAFARTGDPNNPQIPNWAPFDPVNRTTLIIGRDVRVEQDPKAAIRKFWAENPKLAAPLF